MKQRPLPDGTIGKFPDDMPDAAIDQVIQRQYGTTPPPGGPVQAGAMPDVYEPPMPMVPEPDALPWSDLPKNLPGNIYDAGANLVEMAKHPIDTADAMNNLGEGLFLGSETLQDFNSFLSSHGLAKKRDLAAEAKRPSRAVADAFKQSASDNLSSPRRVRNSIIRNPFDWALAVNPVMKTAGTAAQLSKIANVAKTGKAVSTAADFTNPFNLLVKPAGVAMRPLADAWKERKIAKGLGVPRQSMNKVGQSIGNLDVAEDLRSRILGIEGMAASLSPQATQDARHLASMNLPDGSSGRLAAKAQGVIDNSGTRAHDDWQKATGPAQTKFDNRLNVKNIKHGTSNMYELAKGRPIGNPGGIIDEIPKMIDEVRNNPEARAHISEINDMLIDPRSGEFITDAGELVNVRQRLDEMITQLGQGQKATPFADPYKTGLSTFTGRKLKNFRDKINGTLHLDVDLKDADATWSGAARRDQAYELGNEKIIGRGNNMMERQDVAALAKDPLRTVEEQAATLRGLSQRGVSEIGDITGNRNDGMALSNKFVTDNNIERMEALGVDGGILRRMAKRERLLGNTSNRILNGSDTARGAEASKAYPTPGQGGGFSPGTMGTTGGLVSGITGLLAGLDPAMAAMIASTVGGGTAALTKALAAYRNKGLAATAQGSADLLVRQGPAVQKLLDALKAAKKGKSGIGPWNDPALLKALIAGQIAGSAREAPLGPR